MQTSEPPRNIINASDLDAWEESVDPQSTGPIDTVKIQTAVRMILEAIGENPDREGLVETPARVARMYQEIFQGLYQNPHDVLATRFHVKQADLVLVKDIPFYSACEHHLLPFFGVAHIAYLPEAGEVTGLSKLARLVDIFAKRPQVQERMTEDIAQALNDELGAQGVVVMVEAEHLCMAMRGVKKPGSRTLTIAARGLYETEEAKRREVIDLMRRSL
ncbi:GTP cyclohydrolase I [Sulfobacillus acidophilus TPY]|uniref:GTP cyclohydrolase 1 n=1 Tax=Sulfobacillus acidophilus (strain ATCC 700253 / DSM 10332 / NAL) TaxID=679936 RepID=G8TZP0_SULAD|nr:GTP cyclohydrolase I [Sulfobacillus acidophilus TPY]AEW06370.1 GTP cyclohydrolase 1 [Sulfobacillus acidophilus DSM 10332]